MHDLPTQALLPFIRLLVWCADKVPGGRLYLAELNRELCSHAPFMDAIRRLAPVLEVEREKKYFL
jgi:hypothetical protein